MIQKSGMNPHIGAALDAGATVTAPAVAEYPVRRSACVWLIGEANGVWLVLAREHGWMHGCLQDALANAKWLSRNLGLPIRMK